MMVTSELASSSLRGWSLLFCLCCAFGLPFHSGLTPTARLTAETFFLFFQGFRWCAFETEHLIHWFACNIIAGTPTFPVEWTGVFMPAPVRIFCWMRFYCPC